MLIIKCPWCGERDQIEFSYGGEANITRPTDPDKLSDEEWAEYLFFRKNPKGAHEEQWCHTAGCRKWFDVRRDTVTYDFDESYGVETPQQGKALND